MAIDADWGFDQYESVRAAMPEARFPQTLQASQTIAGLDEIANQIDVFLLDAFGVLNVGNRVIEGALEAVENLQSRGKRVLVLTNSASLPLAETLVKFRGFGFDFCASDIISSRATLTRALRGRGETLWGVMVKSDAELGDLGVVTSKLGDDPQGYDTVDGFVLLSSAQWTEARQSLLVASLKRKPRAVLVGNPDIVAPRETGMSVQAGWYGFEIAKRTRITPKFYGKPFQNIYDLMFETLGDAVPAHRIAMVGDTLHTDILGGAHMGIKTVLISGQGVYGGQDVAHYIARSGIVPDWITQSI